MNIFINGQPFQVDTNTLLIDALALFLNTEQQSQSYAVAVNQQFVGKAHYGEWQLQSGDSIDVLFPIQGG